MPKPFLHSNPGRVLLFAAAVFLFSGAAHLLSDSVYAVAIGMPIGITLSFVAIGVAMNDHAKETFLAVCFLPPALWGFFYLLGELELASKTAWGWGVGLLGVLALVRAAMGGSETPATSTT